MCVCVCVFVCVCVCCLQHLAVTSRGGACTARLAWLHMACYVDKAKAMVEVKREGGGGAGGGSSNVCRFCETDLTPSNRHPDPPSPALENVCNDDMCLAAAAGSCTRLLPCGHPCCGVLGEEECLPCLFGCAQETPVDPEECVCVCVCGVVVVCVCAGTFHVCRVVCRSNC